MIYEAIETVEAVIWGAVISFGLIAAGIAFLIIALGYWAGVLAIWTGRRLAARIHDQPHTTTTQPETEPDDELYANWNAWNATTRKEKP